MRGPLEDLVYTTRKPPWKYKFLTCLVRGTIVTVVEGGVRTPRRAGANETFKCAAYTHQK